MLARPYFFSHFALSTRSKMLAIRDKQDVKSCIIYINVSLVLLILTQPFSNFEKTDSWNNHHQLN